MFYRILDEKFVSKDYVEGTCLCLMEWGYMKPTPNRWDNDITYGDDDGCKILSG